MAYERLPGSKWAQTFKKRAVAALLLFYYLLRNFWSRQSPKTAIHAQNGYEIAHLATLPAATVLLHINGGGQKQQRRQAAAVVAFIEWSERETLFFLSCLRRCSPLLLLLQGDIGVVKIIEASFGGPPPPPLSHKCRVFFSPFRV